jgi:iSTAND domain-containing protein/TIR domain-containing protein
VNRPDKPIEVFISYSHKDDDLRHEMMEHLSGLRRRGDIAGWHDRLITAGEDWKGEIDGHLNSAHIVLLLVSASFLDSDYCFDIEMRRAIERHEKCEAEVIPVILRDCDWCFEPLNKFQALPTDGKPITSWPNRDEAFASVVRGIREAIERLRSDFKSVINQPAVRTHPRMGVRPPPPPYLCDRIEQEEELRAALHQHRRVKPQRPMVCLVHGNENEAHSEFLCRLQSRKLPKFLNLDKLSVRDCEWQPHPRYLSDSESLWRNLGDQLMTSGEPSCEELRGFISRHKEPLMICTRWLTESLVHEREKSIEDLLGFWNNWPDIAAKNVIIHFISIKYQFSKKGGLFGFLSRERKLEKLNECLRKFINQLPSISNQKYSNVSVVVLPELHSIPQTDAEAWTHNDEVKRFCRVHERQIAELYKKRGNYPIAMEDFASEIERLINLEG